MTSMPADMRAHNEQLIAQFRAAGRRLEDRPLLLLTTTGARTGRRRTTPMMYVRIGERLLVIASNAGAAKHPDWYRNLVANPDVTVEADGETYDARAVVTAGAERDELFRQVCERFPFFTEHQAGVERTIPVVELVR